jgi:hypothetical protein
VRDKYLLMLASAILAAEEASRKLKSTIAKPRETRVIRITDAVSDTVISEDGPGKLIELVVISDSKEYGVSIAIDNVTVMDESFDWYQSISQYIDWIDAFEDNGSFVLRVTGLLFSSNLKISLRTASPGNVRFKEIIAKIEKY